MFTMIYGVIGSEVAHFCSFRPICRWANYIIQLLGTDSLFVTSFSFVFKQKLKDQVKMNLLITQCKFWMNFEQKKVMMKEIW